MARIDLTEDELRVIVLNAQANIKSVHPADPDSDLLKAIKKDNANELVHYMNLGEFDKDLRSKNAKLLGENGNRGIEALVNLCIDNSADRCMMALIEWTRQTGNPYSIDHKLIFKYAKEKALGPEEKVSCLLKLMEEKITDGDPEELSLRVFPHVKSGEYVKRVHKIMIQNPYNATVPALIEHCAQRFAQPAVIGTLISLAHQRKESIDKIHFGRMEEGLEGRWARTALSEACHSLNVDAIRLLLENGADPRVGTHAGPTSSGYNPLYRLLAQEFRLPLPDNPLNDSSECKRISHPDDDDLYCAITETACRMVDGIELMYGRGYFEIPRYVGTDEFINLYHRAVDIYGETLRNLLIAKIRRHLPPKAQKELIEEKPGPTRSSYFRKEKNEPGPPPTEAEYKFLDSLNGTQLREILERFALQIEPPLAQVWMALMTVENVEWLQTLLKDTIPNPKLDRGTGLLYEFMLDPKSRPLPPTINPGLDSDECDCIDEFLDDFESENNN